LSGTGILETGRATIKMAKVTAFLGKQIIKMSIKPGKKIAEFVLK